jgi:hypothetical protein
MFEILVTCKPEELLQQAEQLFSRVMNVNYSFLFGIASSSGLWR